MSSTGRSGDRSACLPAESPALQEDERVEAADDALFKLEEQSVVRKGCWTFYRCDDDGDAGDIVMIFADELP